MYCFSFMEKNEIVCFGGQVYIRYPLSKIKNRDRLGGPGLGSMKIREALIHARFGYHGSDSYLSGGRPAYSRAKSEKLSIIYFFSISAGGESFSPFFQDRLM